MAKHGLASTVDTRLKPVRRQNHCDGFTAEKACG